MRPKHGEREGGGERERERERSFGPAFLRDEVLRVKYNSVLLLAV